MNSIAGAYQRLRWSSTGLPRSYRCVHVCGLLRRGERRGEAACTVQGRGLLLRVGAERGDSPSAACRSAAPRSRYSTSVRFCAIQRHDVRGSGSRCRGVRRPTCHAPGPRGHGQGGTGSGGRCTVCRLGGVFFGTKNAGEPWQKGARKWVFMPRRGHFTGFSRKIFLGRKKCKSWAKKSKSFWAKKIAILFGRKKLQFFLGEKKCSVGNGTFEACEGHKEKLLSGGWYRMNWSDTE